MIYSYSFFLAIIFSIILRYVGVNPFFSESISIFSGVIFFGSGLNIKNFVLLFTYSILIIIYYLILNKFHLIYCESWIILLLIYLYSDRDVNRDAIFNFLIILYLLCTLIFINNGFNPKIRDGLIFGGPLSLGFFCSTLSIFIFLKYQSYKKYAYQIFPLMLSIVSGSRHPIMVFVLIFIFGLIKEYTIIFKNIKKITLIFFSVFITFFALSFVHLIPHVLSKFYNPSLSKNSVLVTEEYSLNFNSLVSTSSYRSFRTDHSSDYGRIESWKNLGSLDSISKIILGNGRSNTGNVGIRINGAAPVIESSIGTAILANGLLGLFLIFSGFYYKYKNIIKKNEINYIFIILLIEAFISQRFENPTIMLLYLLPLYYALNKS